MPRRLALVAWIVVVVGCGAERATHPSAAVPTRGTNELAIRFETLPDEIGQLVRVEVGAREQLAAEPARAHCRTGRPA